MDSFICSCIPSTVDFFICSCNPSTVDSFTCSCALSTMNTFAYTCTPSTVEPFTCLFTPSIMCSFTWKRIEMARLRFIINSKNIPPTCCPRTKASDRLGRLSNAKNMHRRWDVTKNNGSSCSPSPRHRLARSAYEKPTTHHYTTVGLQHRAILKLLHMQHLSPPHSSPALPRFTLFHFHLRVNLHL